MKQLVIVEKQKQLSGDDGTRFGKLFYHNGKLLRGINNKEAPKVRTLLIDINKLYDIGLVRTNISDYYTNSFDLVLEHQNIDFVSYVDEWPTAMFFDSAKFMVEFNIELVKNELCLYDGHPYNILFDYTRPVFIDLGSIISLSSSNVWLSEFKKHFIDVIQQKTKSEFTEWNSMVSKVIGSTRTVSEYRNSYLWLLEETKKWLSDVVIEPNKTAWSNYPQPSDVNYNDKQKSAIGLLTRLFDSNCESLLDVGSNFGWYSFVAYDCGYKTVSIDLDDNCVSSLYIKAKETGSEILPLKMDFCHPALGSGEYCPADDRLKCDVVMCLSVLHHISFHQNVKSFERFAVMVDKFSKKYVIVEFIPPDDVFVKSWMDEDHKWYNFSNFMYEMGKHFSKFEIFDSTPSPRKLVLFEK